MKTTALITGGSTGIGYELAREFAAHGHDLVLVARHRDALEAAAGKIEGKYGVKVTTFALDLTDPGVPQQLFDATEGAGTQIDFLVNNAGFGLGGEFADTDLSVELDMIQVNVTSLVHLTKLFLQPMLKRRQGRILNVASTAAFQPGPLHSIYYSTKAFVLSFSQAIDEELRNSGVSVTVLCPGPTATNFFERASTTKSRLFNQTMKASAESVAKYGFEAMMRGQRVAIPGMANKAMVQAERFIPRAVVTMLSRKAQENR
jgi:short-subunit dehydrogenase